MLKRKKRSLLLGLFALVAIAAGAYAYWTAGGAGDGSASAAGAQTALVVNQTSTLAAMYPGRAAQTLSGNFDNPNPGPIFVHTVTASIASVDMAVGHATGTCDATDFTLSSPVMTVDAEIAAGSAKGTWTAATLAFNDKTSVNQDACKGATVNLHYVIG